MTKTLLSLLAASVALACGSSTLAQPSVAQTWAAFEAVQRGDAEAIVAMPAGSIDFAVPDKYKRTLLEAACQRSTTRVIKALLDHGASPNAAPIGPGTRPVLSLALTRRDADAVELLLAHGANIDYKDSFGYTTWSILLLDGRYNPATDRRLIELLNTAMIDRGQKNNRIAGESARLIDAALIAAAGAGDQDWCTRFIDEGANVNAEEEGGRTPLFAAVAGGREGVVELLLKRGAKPGTSPRLDAILDFACGARSNSRILRMLIDSSPDVGAVVRRSGEQSLLRKALILGDSKVLETLVRAGADPKQMGPGFDALGVAVDAGNPAAVEFLVRAGFRSGPWQKNPSLTHLECARSRASLEGAIEYRRIVELLEATVGTPAK